MQPKIDIRNLTKSLEKAEKEVIDARRKLQDEQKRRPNQRCTAAERAVVKAEDDRKKAKELIEKKKKEIEQKERSSRVDAIGNSEKHTILALKAIYPQLLDDKINKMFNKSELVDINGDFLVRRYGIVFLLPSEVIESLTTKDGARISDDTIRTAFSNSNIGNSGDNGIKKVGGDTYEFKILSMGDNRPIAKQVHNLRTLRTFELAGIKNHKEIERVAK